MKRYVSCSIHSLFGALYLSLLGAHLAEWEETRNTVLVLGLALCGFGLVTCGVLGSLPSLWQRKGRETWSALSMLGLGLCFLVVAMCGVRWIGDGRKARSSVPSAAWCQRQTLEQQHRADPRSTIERRPAAKAAAARARSSVFRDALAGQTQHLVDSVHSGLDGSRIDALQGTKNQLEPELESLNPYTPAVKGDPARGQGPGAGRQGNTVERDHL